MGPAASWSGCLSVASGCDRGRRPARPLAGPRAHKPHPTIAFGKWPSPNGDCEPGLPDACEPGSPHAYELGLTKIAWPSDHRVSVVSPTITTASGS